MHVMNECKSMHGMSNIKLPSWNWINTVYCYWGCLWTCWL